ncbi:CHAT domain-containing protein [candidate division WOR-3 bacterium]|nr:CHAT domain-containing protein [candidate division WOR-3 bacterium]
MNKRLLIIIAVLSIVPSVITARTGRLGLRTYASAETDSTLKEAERFMKWGRYAEAAEIFEGKIEDAKRSCDSVEWCLMLNRASEAYLRAGDAREAKERAEAALELCKELPKGQARLAALSLASLGNAHALAEAYDEALQAYEQALKIGVNSLGPDDPAVAEAHMKIGFIYVEQGSYREGLNHFRKALEIRRISLGPRHPEIALTHIRIGALCDKHGFYEQAIGNFHKALEIQQERLAPDHPALAVTYNLIGRTYKNMEERDSALFYLEKSVELLEASLSRIQTAEQLEIALRKVSEQYQPLISLLLEEGRTEEAFGYIERSKLKELKEAFEERYDVDLGTGQMKENLDESQRLATEVEDIEEKLADEQAKPDSLRDEEVIADLSESLARTKEEYFTVAAQIQSDPDYAFAVRVNPTDIGVLRSELPEGQKLLMIYSGEKELYLFLVSQEGYEIRTVPVTQDSLNFLVSKCRELCSDTKAQELYEKGMLLGWSWIDDGSKEYTEEVLPLASVLSTLYDYIIEPFETELEGAEIVTFIPSGQFYYLPWGALLDNEEGGEESSEKSSEKGVFLTERFNWNLLTSTELLQCILRRKEDTRTGPSSVLLVGNPMGANLPFAEGEVSSIEQFYPNSTILKGSEATETELEASTPKNEALHLATHCILDTESPWESYIMLARTAETDGHWTAAEISGQSWTDMKLVTLSACETALGSDRPGLEFESMAKAFSLAMEGPPSIVATLWPVADESTKEFMVAFYEALKANPKSEALRKAQQKLIHSEKYSHPFFWGPFVLIGEWR